MAPHCRALDAVSTGYGGTRRRDRLEAVDDLARMARVVGEVEDLVEVEAEVARREQVAQRGGGAPRALRVPHLGGQALEAGARQRDGLQQLGVAIARDDLCRHGLALEAEPSQDALLELRARGRVGAHGAADGSDARLRERALQALGVAV